SWIDATRYGFGEARVTEAVQNDLRDRAAAFDGLEASLVINRLSQAQQSTPLVEVGAPGGERLRWMQGAGSERKGSVDHLGLIADRLHLIGFFARRRFDERIRAGGGDCDRCGGRGPRPASRRGAY